MTVRAACRTTSNKKGERVKTARAVLRVERVTTKPGSFVPDQATLTPVGRRFVSSLLKRIVGAAILRCDGYTATWAASPVDAKTLSTARAKLVCGRLKRRLKVGSRVSAHGHSNPIATNSTEAGRAANRRVVVTVYHRAKSRRPGSKRAD